MTPEWRRWAAIEAPVGPGLRYPDTRVIARPGWYQLLTPSAPRGTLNEVALSEVAAADAEPIIDETIAAYRAIGQPVKWCVGPWTAPADFGERLARRGFESWGVRGMGRVTAGESLAPAPGVAVVEIDPPLLDDYLSVESRGWHDGVAPSEVAREVCRQALVATPRVVHLFAARLDGEWVGSSAIFLRQGYGYLLGAQVLARARGRGGYRAMVAARLAWLAERGVGYAVTQARASTSAPILERLGFESLFESRCYRLDAERARPI